MSTTASPPGLTGIPSKIVTSTPYVLPELDTSPCSGGSKEVYDSIKAYAAANLATSATLDLAPTGPPVSARL